MNQYCIYSLPFPIDQLIGKISPRTLTAGFNFESQANDN